MTKALAVLRGLVLNPLLVAFARGLLEAALMAGLLFGIDALTSGVGVPDELKIYAPFALLVLRQLEGVVDKIDPMKQRRRDVLRSSPITDADGNVTGGYENGDFA